MSLSTKEYFIRETYKSIKRNGLMSLASVSTVALSLLVLGMFLLIFINTNNLAQYLESQVQITVYMEDSVEAGRLGRMSTLWKICLVSSALLKSVNRKLWPDLRNA